jgi:hypothetical protein
VAQLILDADFEQPHLLEILFDSSLPGLESCAREDPLKLPVEYRLPFRELGLSIGLRAVEKSRGLIEENRGVFRKIHALHSRVETLMRYAPLAERIEAFWLEGKNREAGSWVAHRDINRVMLATSLAPDGFLTI